MSILEDGQRAVGALPSDHKPADLNHALSKLLAAAFDDYRDAATVSTQLGELPAVVCNIDALTSVFRNLLVNAARAIRDVGRDASTGRVSISTRVSGECVEVAIADNGGGISAVQLEKIFDPFLTGDEVDLGTGRGLALARVIIIDRHGGTIDVHSAPGQGTRFVISLPARGHAVQSAYGDDEDEHSNG